MAWLAGAGDPRTANTVLELNAGLGHLTEPLVRIGRRVIATDPSPQNLASLRGRVVPFAVGVSGAEAIPSPSQTVDVVICNPPAVDFDHAKALIEINRVLRPGGTLALIWFTRDNGVPWVRRLSKLIGPGPEEHVLSSSLNDSDLFADVEDSSWRTWLRVDRKGLIAYAAAAGVTDEGTLAEVGALYDEYGRGPDGLQMPYVVRGQRGTVHHAASTAAVDAEPVVAGHLEATASDVLEPLDPPEDPGTLLIDFT